jgi:hypothetical protein
VFEAATRPDATGMAPGIPAQRRCLAEQAETPPLAWTRNDFAGEPDSGFRAPSLIRYHHFLPGGSDGRERFSRQSGE